MYDKEFYDLVVPIKELYSKLIYFKVKWFPLDYPPMFQIQNLEHLHQYPISRKGRQLLEKLSIILLPIPWALPKEGLLSFLSVL